jgi:hypothetical protein
MALQPTDRGHRTRHRSELPAEAELKTQDTSGYDLLCLLRYFYGTEVTR